MLSFVVIPFRDNLDMTRALVAQLIGQAQADVIFMMNNGAPGPSFTFCEVVECEDWNLHRMMNAGMGLAKHIAAGLPHNTAILNNDIVIGPNFLSGLSTALRSNDNLALVSPNMENWPGEGVFMGTRGDEPGMYGPAFMVKGEEWERPFWEELGWWYGETDLVAQIEHSGRNVGIVYDTYMEHIGGGSQTHNQVGYEIGGIDPRAHDAELFYSKWPQIVAPSKVIPRPRSNGE